MSGEALPGMSLATDVEVVRPRTTERDVLNLLAQRYSVVSQGVSVRYAYAEHVRSHAGFDARRTADFIAMDLWPMKGLHLHGHEVKVSRSDWLTELRDPSKAEEFKRYMDRWWLVVSDRSIVKPGELPDGWGLMAPDKHADNARPGVRTHGNLRVIRPAPILTPEPMPRTMFAALLRAVSKTAHREAARCMS